MSLNLGRGALPGVVSRDVFQKFGRRFVPVKQCWGLLYDEGNGLCVQTVVHLEQDGTPFKLLTDKNFTFVLMICCCSTMSLLVVGISVPGVLLMTSSWDT